MQTELSTPYMYSLNSAFSFVSCMAFSHQVLSLEQFISLQAHFQPQKDEKLFNKGGITGSGLHPLNLVLTCPSVCWKLVSSFICPSPALPSSSALQGNICPVFGLSVVLHDVGTTSFPTESRHRLAHWQSNALWFEPQHQPPLCLCEHTFLPQLCLGLCLGTWAYRTSS